MSRDLPIVSVDSLSMVLGRVTFAPCTVIEVVDFELQSQQFTDACGFFMFRVAFRRPDTLTGTIGVGRGRWWAVEVGSHPDVIIKTAYLAYRQIVEHEAMEAFLVDDERLFDPHRSVADLLTPENP